MPVYLPAPGPGIGSSLPTGQLFDSRFWGLWVPQTFTGLVAWYRADAGTDTVTDGAAVSQWNDQSGSGNHLTQATGSQQPTYETNEQNGLPVIRFDGSNDFMDAAAVNVPQPSTIFLVAKTTATSGAHNAFDGTTARQVIFQQTSGVVSLYAGGTLADSTAAWGSSLHYITAMFNGAVSTLRVDGADQTLSANPGTSALTGLRVGAFDATTSQWQGDIGELIIYNRELAAAEQQSVEAYLGRWFGTVSTVKQLAALGVG